jgi:4-alpha-glucanotransferase
MHFVSLVLTSPPTFSGVHVTLESLLDDKDIQATIKDLVTSSGRSFPGKVGGADESGEKLSKVQLNGKA